MQIKNNQKYKEQTIELRNLQEEYSQKYKDASEKYWPVYDQFKRKTKNCSYFMGAAICLIAVVTFCVILRGLRNEYLIAASYVLSVGIFIFTIILYARNYKKFNAFNKEWTTINNDLENIQNKIRVLHDDMVEEMIRIICFNKYHYNDEKVDINEWDQNYQKVREDILKETSQSLVFDDVRTYFENWSEKF